MAAASVIEAVEVLEYGGFSLATRFPRPAQDQLGPDGFEEGEEGQKTVRGAVFPTTLHVRRRGCRKRAIGTRAPMLVPMAPNQQCSLDFVSDELPDGRRFRTLTVVDNCTRECLALIADTSLSGARVARELATIIERRGKPMMIISDRGESENDPGDRFPKEGHRVHLERYPGLRRQTKSRLALYRAGEADAERLYRKLERAGCATNC